MLLNTTTVIDLNGQSNGNRVSISELLFGVLTHLKHPDVANALPAGTTHPRPPQCVSESLTDGANKSEMDPKWT